MPKLIALFRNLASGKRQELNSDVLAYHSPVIFKLSSFLWMFYCLFQHPRSLTGLTQAIGWLSRSH